MTSPFTKNPDGYSVAIVGATGAVGRVMIEKLIAERFPISELRLLASARSAGTEIEGVGRVRELTSGAIEGCELALFSAGGTTSARWAQEFVARGAIVIDNSSQWRREPSVPLVVSEVNPETLEQHNGIIANPNCSTIQLVVALKPIHDAVGIRRLVISTYQSASGTGRDAVEELRSHSGIYYGENIVQQSEIYPHPLPGNVIAAGNFAPGDDYTDEEGKIVFETRKILDDQEIAISATCARVPVPWCHSESVNVETRAPLTAERCKTLLREAPGVTVIDRPATHGYPTPHGAVGLDDVFVGRIRDDRSCTNAINIWIVADNLLKGAATNAVQLALQLDRRGLIGRRALSRA